MSSYLYGPALCSRCKWQLPAPPAPFTRGLCDACLDRELASHCAWLAGVPGSRPAALR